VRIAPLIVLAALLYVVVPEPYAIDRELALLPFGALAATFGVERMLRERWSLEDRRHRFARAGAAPFRILSLT